MKNKFILTLFGLLCMCLVGCTGTAGEDAKPNTQLPSEDSSLVSSKTTPKVSSSGAGSVLSQKDKKNENDIAGDKEAEQAIDEFLDEIDELEKILEDMEKEEKKKRRKGDATL